MLRETVTLAAISFLAFSERAKQFLMLKYKKKNVESDKKNVKYKIYMKKKSGVTLSLSLCLQIVPDCLFFAPDYRCSLSLLHQIVTPASISDSPSRVVTIFWLSSLFFSMLFLILSEI